ncbi:ATP-binding cassette domain-containing protein [Aliagarivorans marinus]|uniref:ATP-binding cassette domain-containing protein n=1 Tax=Aliagarivorans marinus TaxID=561965 RepID=UPI0004017B44|nr:ATP-binding cassette domain-containing protein [Aliagarivorans marinus]
MSRLIDFADIEGRLEQFRRPEFIAHSLNSPLLMGLSYFLVAVKWEGTPNILSDAFSDHDDDIKSFAQTLSKLNYVSQVERNIDATSIEQSRLPCLFITDNVSAIALARQGAELLVYDYEADSLYLHKLEGVRCSTCYASEYSKIFREPPPASQDRRNWLKHAFYSYNDEIRSLAMLSLIINLLGTVQPFFIMSVYNFALSASSIPTLLWITSLALVVSFAEFFFKRMRMRILSSSGKVLAHHISLSVISKLLWLPYSMTSTAGVSSQIARIRDIEQFRKFVTAESTLSYFDLPFVVIYIVAITVMSGAAALTVLAGIALMLCFCVISRYYYAQATARSSRANATVSYQWNEILRNIPLVQGLPVVRVLNARFGAALDQSITDSRDVAVTNGKIQSIGQSLIQVIGSSSIVVAVFGVMQGTSDAGAMLAIVILVWKALGPIMGIYNSLTKFNSIKAAAAQINALMSLEDDASHMEKSPPVSEFDGRYTVDGLSHRYQGLTTGLTNLSFKIAPGDKVAISGPAGSGKTTLISILSGIEERFQGNMFVDGYNSKQFNSFKFRSSINLIPMEFHVFDASFYYNAIAYNGFCTRERAARLFSLFGLERWLREGIDTQLDYELTNQLPNSAKQLLRLCLGLCGSSKSIVIIDEPLLGCEKEYTRLLSKLFHEELASATVIYVTSSKPLLSLASHCMLLEKDGNQKFFGAPDKVIKL